jgi:ubiquitin-conjugating enzyme E2 J1
MATGRNISNKRIEKEIRDMQQSPCQYYKAGLVDKDDNTYWHFTFKGPLNSEYEKGIYHGKILLPSTYPFDPPIIKILTKNGRFETDKKILCLQDASPFSIDILIQSLMWHMTTREEGADGALNCTAEERRRLARKSVLHVWPIYVLEIIDISIGNI